MEHPEVVYKRARVFGFVFFRLLGVMRVGFSFWVLAVVLGGLCVGLCGTWVLCVGVLVLGFSGFWGFRKGLVGDLMRVLMLRCTCIQRL